MRDAIGGAWLYSLVLIFIVIFASFLAISLNYSKAFQMKDEVLRIIELYEGHDEDLVLEHLAAQGYFVHGRCSGERGRGEGIGGRFLYCISDAIMTSDDGRVPVGYYDVTLFFRFDLPLVGHIFTFPVSGRTRPIPCIENSCNLGGGGI